MPEYIEGKILVATPRVNGKIFRHTVIYIHADDDTGSVGVMLNVPMDYEMAERWSKEINWQFPEKIYHGGPVERQLGYVIHSNEYAQESTIQLNEYLSYTSGPSIIRSINRGIGPHNFMLATGYCAWQPKQLRSEIENGMWKVVDFDIEYFFQDLDREHGWEFSVNVAAQNLTQNLLNLVDTE